jgi:hypothetical protein
MKRSVEGTDRGQSTPFCPSVSINWGNGNNPVRVIYEINFDQIIWQAVEYGLEA